MIFIQILTYREETITSNNTLEEIATKAEFRFSRAPEIKPNVSELGVTL